MVTWFTVVFAHHSDALPPCWPVAGTFAGIAMGLNGVATSLLVPLLLGWF
jgi:hypothetical protein